MKKELPVFKATFTIYHSACHDERKLKKMIEDQHLFMLHLCKTFNIDIDEDLAFERDYDGDFPVGKAYYGLSYKLEALVPTALHLYHLQTLLHGLEGLLNLLGHETHVDFVY